ncbi:MAG: DegV family protein [Bacilli bacterium]
MKYKIILDSSSNIREDFYKDENISIEIAPLTVSIDGKDFVDDGKADIAEMLRMNHVSKVGGKTTCPSPFEYVSKMNGADKYILITISSKLSGSYNSANVAKSTYEHPEDVIVIDSLSSCGVLELIARKAIDLIHEGVDFAEIEEQLNTFRDNSYILFIMEKYDNFIRTGRVNKIIASLATLLHIKPLATGKNGIIELKEKVRTITGTMKRILANIKSMCPNTTGKVCVISHTMNEKDALILKGEIEREFNFKEIVIRVNETLCAFYSLEGALMVSF